MHVRNCGISTFLLKRHNICSNHSAVAWPNSISKIRASLPESSVQGQVTARSDQAHFTIISFGAPLLLLRNHARNGLTPESIPLHVPRPLSLSLSLLVPSDENKASRGHKSTER